MPGKIKKCLGSRIPGSRIWLVLTMAYLYRTLPGYQWLARSMYNCYHCFIGRYSRHISDLFPILSNWLKIIFCCFYTLLVMVHCKRDWEGSLVDQHVCITVTTGLWAFAGGIFLTYFQFWSNRLICCFLAVSTPCLLRYTMRETEKGFWLITMYV